MAKKSQIGIRALIVSGDGLVVAEHEEKGERLIVFPGGGLEEGEAIFEGVAREVKEETNLDVVPERIVYIREVIVGNSHGVEFYILCRLNGGNLSLGVDPEYENGNFVLRGVHQIPIDDFAHMPNWYPKELHHFIADDFKKGFPENRFLGTVRF